MADIKNLLAIGFHGLARGAFDGIPAFDAPEAEVHRKLAADQADLAALTLGEPGGIGWALGVMREGNTVRRRGWNGKNMYLALEKPAAGSKMTLPYVFMRTAQGDFVPWLCSQSDLLADDWEVAD